MPVTVLNYIRNPGMGGKFILLLDKTDPDSGLAVFSDFSRDFQHHDILMRWQETHRTTLAQSPFRIAGGGWWKAEGGRLVVYGQSAAYGRFDPDWLRPRLLPGMVLHETEIDVR